MDNVRRKIRLPKTGFAEIRREALGIVEILRFWVRGLAKYSFAKSWGAWTF